MYSEKQKRNLVFRNWDSSYRLMLFLNVRLWPIITAYYPSTYNLQNSLTIYNSSSSEFYVENDELCFIVSAFVLAYIALVWKKLDAKNISEKI